MDNHCSTIISGMTSKKMSILRLGNFEATNSSPMSLFYVRMVSRWRHTKSSWLLQVLFWGNFPEVQTSSSTNLPERISSKRLWCNSWLPLFWWGKCFRRVFRFFPRYGWGNQGERPHCWWSNIQWDQEGGRRGKRHWTIFHNAKTTTRRKDMKPNADSSSSNTSIPDKSRTDMQALEEKVKSMMEKGQKMITVGKQTKDGKPTRASSWICKDCGKEGSLTIIRQHIESAHLEGISISCDYCDKTFSSRTLLASHKSKFHQWKNTVYQFLQIK